MFAATADAQRFRAADGLQGPVECLRWIDKKRAATEEETGKAKQAAKESQELRARRAAYCAQALKEAGVISGKVRTALTRITMPEAAEGRGSAVRFPRAGRPFKLATR